MSLPERVPISLEALRPLVRPGVEREPIAQAPTGIAELDSLLGGGLPRRRLSEIAGARSSGRTSLALAVLAAATRRGEATALVDVDGSLDARSAESSGVLLERLLWVHAGELRHGLQATEWLVGVGGFGLIVLDLGERPPQLADTPWRRLARRAEQSAAPGTVLLIVSPASATGSPAALRLSLRGGGALVDGQGAEPRLLRGLATQLEVTRSRTDNPGRAISLRWRRR